MPTYQRLPTMPIYQGARAGWERARRREREGARHEDHRDWRGVGLRFCRVNFFVGCSLLYWRGDQVVASWSESKRRGFRYPLHGENTIGRVVAEAEAEGG